MTVLTKRQLALLMGNSTSSTTIIIQGPPWSDPDPFDPPPDPFPPELYPTEDPDNGGGGGGGGGEAPPPPPPQPPPNCIPPLPPAPRVEISHISRNEGVRPDTYILPPAAFPNSGVTIAMGVDLATHSSARLLNWGVPQTTVDLLAPFLGTPTTFGPRGTAAQAALNQHGVTTLDEATVELLSRGGLDYTRRIVQANYDRDQTTGVTFAELPAEAQTVIVDIAYPNGPNLNVSAPRFWRNVTRGDFGTAVSELNNWFGPGNSNQRYRSASQLLASAIAAQRLPTTASAGRCD